MSFRDFVIKWRKRYKRRGRAVITPMLGDFSASVLGHIAQNFPYGERIYDREWDMLVILDACRHDTYENVIGPCEKFRSCAGASPEWMEKNFTSRYEEEMLNTAYITGNPFSGDYFSEEDFGVLDEVWRHSWDEDLGTQPPRPLTDRAIQVGRNHRFDRIIVHYMQPHWPFIGDTRIEGYEMTYRNFGRPDSDNPPFWTSVGMGDIDQHVAFEGYKSNLRAVWEDVELLLQNFDGTIAISADHGNAFGDFGIWGHRRGIPLPSLLDVPWDVRTAIDEEIYEPQILDQEDGGYDVEEQLRQLGYK